METILVGITNQITVIWSLAGNPGLALFKKKKSNEHKFYILTK